MIRRIIRINEDRCNGCGMCVDACHEGAIEIIDGKARLLREDYCDGLGDCLPTCPMNAISFEEREAAAYDEAAVLAAKKEKTNSVPCGCPGTICKSISRLSIQNIEKIPSQLANFPVQIKLVPVNAPYFNKADLLIAADCTAYAYGNFHNEFIRDKVTLIGCPKLDSADYAEKLTEIFKSNKINSITVVRMTVPCCGGLSHAVKTAIERSGKNIPHKIITISPEGKRIG